VPCGKDFKLSSISVQSAAPRREIVFLPEFVEIHCTD